MTTWLVAAEPSLTKLNLAYPAEGTIITAQVGLVLENTDILKRHGLTANIKSMGTGRELKTALVSGHADIIMTSQTNFTVLLGSGFDCQALHSLGSAGRLALVVKPSSPVRALNDLKGRRVATIFGTSIHQPLLQWLDADQLRESTKVVDMGSMAAMQAALQTGSVDAIMTWDPFLADGLARGLFRVVREEGFALITVASRKFASDKATATRFNAAIRDALYYFATHKAEVNGWYSTRSGIPAKTLDTAARLNLNYLATSPGDIRIEITPAVRERLRSESEFLFKEKLIATRPDFKAAFF